MGLPLFFSAVEQYISVDFVASLIILNFFLFLHMNKAYEPKTNRLFANVFILIFALVLVDNLYYYAIKAGESEYIKKYCLLVGYCLRGFVLMTSVFVLKRRGMSKKEKVINALPAILITLVISTSFLYDKTFWTTPLEEHYHGFYFNITHILCLHYFVSVFVLMVDKFKKNNKEEGLFLGISLLGVFISISAEAISNTRGLFICANCTMNVFYYLYLHMESFKRDPLTSALNRMSFFADIKKYKETEIAAFCEIDMNGLKQINDTQGHTAGDAAILSMSKVLFNNLPKNSYLYRLGGDEFAILFLKSKDLDLDAVFQKIDSDMKAANCSFAVGISEWKKGMTFQEIFEIADKRMYDNKRKYKESQKEDKIVE